MTRNARRLGASLLLVGASILGVAGWGYTGRLRAQTGGPLLECPNSWSTGWNWSFFGISMTGGLYHQDIKFLITSASRIPNTNVLVPPTNPQWWAAWYKLSPDPATSVWFDWTYGKSRWEWSENKAFMRCEWLDDDFLLVPVRTEGKITEVQSNEGTCDDVAQGGCGPGDEEGAPTYGDFTATGNGGPPLGEPEIRYFCDIYYEYDPQTGAVLYWDVIQCYIA